MIAEDNPDVAETLVLVLELLGHHVRVVHDGVTAVSAARANPPDIMLIDIGLPRLNGDEVAQTIRRDPALKQLMLVAITGYGGPEDKARAMAAGFDYHLAKPVDLNGSNDLVGRLGGRSPTKAPFRAASVRTSRVQLIPGCEGAAISLQDERIPRTQPRRLVSSWVSAVPAAARRACRPTRQIPRVARQRRRVARAGDVDDLVEARLGRGSRGKSDNHQQSKA